MKVLINNWVRPTPTDLPSMDADGFAELSAEEIIALAVNFDVMLIQRGGLYSYNIYGNKKLLKKPEPQITVLSLDVKGGCFKQR